MKNNTNNFYILFLLVLLCSMIFSSCWSSYIPRDIKKSIEYCYDAKPSGLDTIIRLNGYYETTYNFILRGSLDSNQTCFLFYPDGLFLRIESSQNYVIEDYLKKNSSISQQRWGNYVVENDTIKTFYFDGPHKATWIGYEDYYKINNDTTLTLFYSSTLTTNYHDRVNYQNVRKKVIKNTSEARFHKLDSLPNPQDSWIMKAKWFKCKEKGS